MKPGKKSGIKLMDENNDIISDSKHIANIFNDHFSTLGARVQQKIPACRGSYNDYLLKKGPDGKPIINPDGFTFFLSPTKPDEISKIIDKLDPSKSTGPVGIPVVILKTFKLFFSFWLSKLINLCFETGIYIYYFPMMIKIYNKQCNIITIKSVGPNLELATVLSVIFHLLIKVFTYFHNFL